jgi:hypothetical protein
MNKVQPLRPNEQKILQKQNFWSKIVTEWHKERISPSVFCKDKNINKDHFYYWRRRLERLHASTGAKDGSFIEINSLSTPVIEKKAPLLENHKLLLEIMLPNKINIMATIPTMDIGKIIHQLGGLILC